MSLYSCCIKCKCVSPEIPCYACEGETLICRLLSKEKFMGMEPNGKKLNFRKLKIITKIQENWREVESQQRKNDEILEQIFGKDQKTVKDEKDQTSCEDKESQEAVKDETNQAMCKDKKDQKIVKDKKDQTICKDNENQESVKDETNQAMCKDKKDQKIVKDEKDQTICKDNESQESVKDETNQAMCKDKKDQKTVKDEKDQTICKDKESQEDVKDEKDQEICKDIKDLKSVKNGERKVKKMTIYNTLCWNCSKTQVKLYKCGGCLQARYCTKDCLEQDWNIHGNYCEKIQKKLEQKKIKREINKPI